MLDEPLFSLEMNETPEDEDDDDNRFIINDTGVDPLQIR